MPTSPETLPGFTISPGGIALPTDIRASDTLSDLKHPSAWLTNWATGGVGLSGTYVSPQTSMALSTYYACLRVIAEDCAKLPLQILRRLPRGREKLYDHTLWELLNEQPNPDMSAITFREVVTQHAAGWGNGYALILRDRSMGETDGDAVGLYPVHPSRVTLRRAPSGVLVYDIATDNSSLSTVSPRTRMTIAAQDMLHIKGLGADGLTGYSVASVACESLGLSLAAQTFGAAFFGNSTRMGGVLETPGQLSETALKHLKESFAEQYGGPSNTGKNLILEEGLKFSRIGIPPNEAQFLETRQFQVREICRWFRMQPHKVADLTDAHHTNIESQNIEHVVDTLLPWLLKWEQEIDRKLLAGQRIIKSKHDTRALLRGDSQARADYYHKQFMVGALSPNDIREFEDQNPYPGGDEYFLQIQYAPVPKIVDGTARAARNAPGRPARAPVEDSQPQEDAYAPTR